MQKFQRWIEKYSPYLDDIRKRLYVMAIIFIIFFVLGFIFTGYILRNVLVLFDLSDVVIATTSPFQFADLSINIGLATAFLISCPVLIYNIFSFLNPALTRSEKKVFLLLIPVGIALFALGFLYGFFIMYYALGILAHLNSSLGIQNIWDIGLFLSQIIFTSLLLGVLFQFPIIFTFIVRMGIISAKILEGKRRLAVGIIFIFTALLPPTDGLSLLAMALPLVVLYEVTIFVNARLERGRREGSRKLLA